MKFFNLFILLILFTVSSTAQTADSLRNIYNSQTIYRFGNRFIKGNTVLSYGQLAGQFTTPQTISLYYVSRKKASVGRIFSLGAFAVFIASLFTKTNTLGSIGFIAGSGVLNLTGYFFQTESSMYVERALWEHNREVLFGPN